MPGASAAFQQHSCKDREKQASSQSIAGEEEPIIVHLHVHRHVKTSKTANSNQVCLQTVKRRHSRIRQKSSNESESGEGDIPQKMQKGLYKTRKRKSSEVDERSAVEETTFNGGYCKVRHLSSDDFPSDIDENCIYEENQTGLSSDLESYKSDSLKLNVSKDFCYQGSIGQESCSVPLLPLQGVAKSVETESRQRKVFVLRTTVIVTMTFIVLAFAAVSSLLLFLRQSTTDSSTSFSNQVALSTTPLPTHSRRYEDFKGAPKALIFIGGDRGGFITDLVEVSPFGSSASCGLPPLPEKLRWGNAGFVSGSLLVCGGERENTHPSRTCWVLKSKQGKWTALYNMTRSKPNIILTSILTDFYSPRSQSTSSVSKDGSLLHIIGGKSHLKDLDYALPSTESVGLYRTIPQQTLMSDTREINSCQRCEMLKP